MVLVELRRGTADESRCWTFKLGQHLVAHLYRALNLSPGLGDWHEQFRPRGLSRRWRLPSHFAFCSLGAATVLIKVAPPDRLNRPHFRLKFHKKFHKSDLSRA